LPDPASPVGTPMRERDWLSAGHEEDAGDGHG
jgi:hypothetical protein